MAATSASASARVSATSTPLPAARPSVFTTQGPGRVRRNRTASSTRSKAPKARRRHPGLVEELLHEPLRPLEERPVGPRADHPRARGPQPVGQPVDQRPLGPDHHQVGLDLLGRGRGDGDAVALAVVAGMPGLPGVTTTSAVRASTRGQGVLAAARAHHADRGRPGGRHRGGPAGAWRARHAVAKDTNCSRPGPTPTSRTSTPTWAARKAT